MVKVERHVVGTDRACRVAKHLIHKSQWFELMPMPYDQYAIIVKAENDGLLRELIMEVMTRHPLTVSEQRMLAEAEDE